MHGLCRLGPTSTLMQRDKTELIGILLILAIGATLRIWGISFGLPMVSNFYVRPDESLIVQTALLLFERNGDPQFFAYPALMPELCALLFAPLRKAVGSFAENPSAYFLAVRWLSVVAGTATIVVVWRNAKLLCNRNWALTAALLYAVATLPIRDAHFGVTDTLLSLFVALALWACTAYAQAPVTMESGVPWKAGAWWGLAFSTKYTAALSMPAMAAAMAERINWNEQAGQRVLQASRLLLPAVALALGIFALLNPYVFLRFEVVQQTMGMMFGVFYGGKSTAMAAPWNPAFAMAQIMRPLAQGPGGLIGLGLAVASLWWLSPRRWTPGLLTVVCGTLPLLTALLPFRHPLPYRYALPAMAGVAILATFTASRLAAKQRLRAGIVLLFILLAGWQLQRSALLVNALSQPDTRSLAGSWVEREIPPDVPIVLFGLPEAEPQIPESTASLRRRVQHVSHRYGEESGRLVSELYQVLIAANPEGREVYRSPAPEEVPGDQCLIVIPSYPGTLMGASSTDVLRLFGGTIREREFLPFVGPTEDAVVDGIDAFFLPFNPAGIVERPGPHLKLFLVQRTRM